MVVENRYIVHHYKKQTGLDGDCYLVFKHSWAVIAQSEF